LIVVMRPASLLRRSLSEEDRIAMQDSLYGVDKEPPKNWYFLP